MQGLGCGLAPLPSGEWCDRDRGWWPRTSRPCARPSRRTSMPGSRSVPPLPQYHRGQKVVDLWWNRRSSQRADVGRGCAGSRLLDDQGHHRLCAHRLAQQGLLDVEAPVATYLPSSPKRARTHHGRRSPGPPSRTGLDRRHDVVRRKHAGVEPGHEGTGTPSPLWPPGTAHGTTPPPTAGSSARSFRRVTGVSLVRSARRDTGPLDAGLFSSVFPLPRSPAWHDSSLS